MFFRGLGDLSKDSRLMADSSAYVALNADLRRRRGVLQAAKATLPVNLRTTADIGEIKGLLMFREKLMLSAGGQIYWGSFREGRQTFSARNNLSAVVYNGTCYLTNGVEFLKTSDGETYTTPYISAPDASSITISEVSGSITAFANGGGGQVIVTSAAHGLAAEDEVEITGTTNYDGTYTIVSVTTDTFTISATWAGDDATGTWAQTGHLEAGEYYYLFTWRTDNRRVKGANRDESPPSGTVTKTIAGNRRLLLSNLPTQDGYTLVAYRWRIGTGSLYREVAEMMDAATSYTDNLYYEELGDAIATEEYQTPPVPRHLVRFNNNLFAIGLSSWLDRPVEELDNIVVYSDDRRFSGWGQGFEISVSDVDDAVLTGLVIGNSLALYTKAKIFLVKGVSAASYRLTASLSPVGLAAEWALADAVQYGHIFLGSDRRLHLFTGVGLSDPAAFRWVDKLFEEGSDYPYAMNWAKRETAFMAFFDQAAYLAYPSGTSLTPDKILKIDFISFPEIIFTLLDVPVTVLFADTVNHALYGGNSAGEVFILERGSTYLPVTYRTKDYDAGDIHTEKVFERLVLDFDSQGQDITVKLYLDDAENNTFTVNQATRAVKEETWKTFGPLNKGKRWALELTWDQPAYDLAVYDFNVFGRTLKY